MTSEEIMAGKELTTFENVGEILQHIYDSEIHLQLGWCWDGGIDYSIGYPVHAVTSTGCRSITDAIELIIIDICNDYPDSEFVRWWRTHV